MRRFSKVFFYLSLTSRWRNFSAFFVSRIVPGLHLLLKQTRYPGLPRNLLFSPCSGNTGDIEVLFILVESADCNTHGLGIGSVSPHVYVYIYSHGPLASLCIDSVSRSQIMCLQKSRLRDRKCRWYLRAWCCLWGFCCHLHFRFSQYYFARCSCWL